MNNLILDYEIISFSKKDKKIDFKDIKIHKGLNILLGKNGSGKTTLIHCLLNLEKTNIKEKKFNDNNTLYITSDFLFDHEKDIEENIKFIYKCIFNKQIDVEMVLNEMSINEERDKSILKISTGTLKKIHISPLFFLDYDYYFLDEICTNLDNETVEKVINQIIKLVKLGKTIIISEHNQQTVEILSKELGENAWKVNL